MLVVVGYVAFFPSIFIPTFAYFSCVSGRPSTKEGGNIFFFSFLTLGFCILFVFISLLLYTIKSRLQQNGLVAILVVFVLVTALMLKM